MQPRKFRQPRQQIRPPRQQLRQSQQQHQQVTTTATTKEKAKRNNYSNCDNYSFQIRLYSPKGSALVTVASINDERSYDMGTAFTTFARHRRRNTEQSKIGTES
ncbi:hypothetical protein [Absidia glauca]|uniref:Uncharacterized protein n=1 Tax=Absidia glauca TaxID=4829 RepID=A0A168MY69_ABSGL|nr:hypothetical protein [Absidia glauca]